MSKKRIFSKKGIIVIAVIIVGLVGLVGGLTITKNFSKPNPKEERNIIEKDKVESKDKIEKENISDNQTETSKPTEDDTKKEQNSSNDNKVNNSTTNKKTTTNNNQVQNNTKSNNSSNTTNNSNNKNNGSSEQPKENKVPDVPSEQPKPTNDNVDLTKVVDTNSFFYSIHKGQKDTATESGCLKAGEDIANKELDQVMEYNEQHPDNQKSVDINYFRCYEVTSKADTVMYYYLNIFCNSGNCNRYKTLVDMSKY